MNKFKLNQQLNLSQNVEPIQIELTQDFYSLRRSRAKVKNKITESKYE